jgi:hypothetical protein
MNCPLSDLLRWARPAHWAIAETEKMKCMAAVRRKRVFNESNLRCFSFSNSRTFAGGRLTRARTSPATLPARYTVRGFRFVPDGGKESRTSVVERWISQEGRPSVIEVAVQSFHCSPFETTTSRLLRGLGVSTITHRKCQNSPTAPDRIPLLEE